jgi:hypothetical protein
MEGSTLFVRILRESVYRSDFKEQNQQQSSKIMFLRFVYENDVIFETLLFTEQRQKRLSIPASHVAQKKIDCLFFFFSFFSHHQQYFTTSSPAT